MRHLLLVMFLFAGDALSFAAGSSDLLVAIRNGDHSRVQKSPTPPAAWPTATFFGDEHELYFNGESIQVIHQPSANTDGDSLVYFRRSDVISTGDLFVLNSFPVIDPEKGGSLQGVIDGLNRILDIAIPEFNEEGGTLIVPGAG